MPIRACGMPVSESRTKQVAMHSNLVRSLREQILEMSLADERELDQLDAAAREHLASPTPS